MIISLRYRIKFVIATNFRRWATERLKEYMIKGFTMDDERLKQLVSGYFDFVEIPGEESVAGRGRILKSR